MSGLDIQLGSQQFAEQSRWRGMEYEQRAGQFQSQQNLQQAALHAEMKMQAFQMERQMNQQKIQEMLAIDSLEQSRAQTSLINEQVEMARIQRKQMEDGTMQQQSALDRLLDNEKRKFSEWDKDPTLGFAAGWVQDTGSRFGWRPGDEEEIGEALKRHERVRPQSRRYDPAKDPKYRYYEQALDALSRGTFTTEDAFNKLQQEFRDYVMQQGGDPDSIKVPERPQLPKYAQMARQSAYTQASPAAQFIMQQPKLAATVDLLMQQWVELALKLEKGTDSAVTIDNAIRTFWENPGLIGRILQDSDLSEPEIQQLIQQWYGLK